jgi:hypothetical protein
MLISIDSGKLIGIRQKLQMGLKAQLMRGDRSFEDCWKISLDVVDRVVNYINNLDVEVEEVVDES